MRTRVLRRASVAALTFVVLLPTGAFADNLVADGDGVTPVANQNLPLGTVCAGSTTTKSVLIGVSRNGAAGSPNVFANSSTVTVSVSTVTGSGLSASMTTTSISIPANWSTQPNTTITSSTVLAAVTLVAGGPGAFAGSVTFQGTGLNASSNSIDRSDVVAVTATVVGCDTTPPVLVLPSPITAEATGPAGAAVTFTATATDADPAYPAVTCLPPSGSTFALGSTTVTCSATDAAGNTATGSFTVTVVDTTPPTVSPPADVTAEATGPSGAIVSYGAATATDLVDGSVPATCLPASGMTFALGSTTVTCSATDAAGNTGTATFQIIVQDTTDPVLVLPADLTAEATDPAGAAMSFSATASDLVDGSVPVTCVPPSGSTFALDATTTVDCSATDAAGNTATGSFSVSVVDTTPPAITLPAPMTAEATGPAGAAVSFSATASDLVDGAVPVTCVPPSGSTFALGSTTVTCSATDAHGNGASATVQRDRRRYDAPALTLPADQFLEATGRGGAVASFTATATDIVDGDLTPSCDANWATCSPSGRRPCTAR